MHEAHQGIKVAAQRTGLSAHVIRIWEKRYDAVEPIRTETNRRLYSEEQIERLILLREITQNGHSIGNVAKIPTEQLRELLSQSHPSSPPARTAAPTEAAFLDECIEAVKALDNHALEDTLKRAVIALGAQGLLHRVIAPLLQNIGHLWSVGTLRTAHGHFATAVIRVFLGHASKPFAGVANGPVIIVATPAGQIHELGALLVGASAANLGWNVIYLGASLPAAEIAGAAIQKKARAVALSLVYPGDSPQITEELKWLRELLPPEIAIVVGGRAMPDYDEVLEKIGALKVNELAQLSSILEDLRKPVMRER